MADNSYQFNLFNFGKENYKITKPIRLIELFAGIGAQAKALEVLGVPFEHYKICEWAEQSIKAYNSIHIKDFVDYSVGKTKQELIDYLQGNISTDYNTACNVSKKNEQWLRETYNNCVATHNLMNIMKTHGKDLEIIDVDKFEYVMTYSFPCQDLSLAGTRQGMATSQANGGTRSGLLWEVERILDELENKPQILLMENVPEVIGTKNVEHFNKWLAKLESLGYSNFFQILNAKDYGIPQNRKRCFMVSILGEWAYDFPLKIKLEYRLKDFLEKEVDEKYYLSEKMIRYITQTGTKDFSVNNSKINCEIARPVTTEQNKRAGTTNYVCEDLPDNADLKEYKSIDRVIKNIHEQDEEVSPTITANAMGSINHQNCVLIKEYGNKALNETLEQNEIKDFSFVDVYNRKVNNSGLAGIIVGVSFRNETFVAIPEATKKGYAGAMGGDGVYLDRPHRIRKLTPLETMKLMGFEKKDHDSMREIGLSDAQIYHCAGDSIVVTCLMGLFGTMLMNEKELSNKIKDYVERIS